LNRAEKVGSRENGRLDNRSKLEENVLPFRAIEGTNIVTIGPSRQSPVAVNTPRALDFSSQAQIQASYPTPIIRYQSNGNDQMLDEPVEGVESSGIEDAPQSNLQAAMNVHEDENSSFIPDRDPSSPDSSFYSPNTSHDLDDSMRSSMADRSLAAFSDHATEETQAHVVEGSDVSLTVAQESSRSEQSSVCTPSPSVDQRHGAESYVREIPSAPSTPHTPSVHSSATTSASGGQVPAGFPPPYPHYPAYPGPYLPYMYPTPFPEFPPHGSHNMTPTSSTHSLQFAKNNEMQHGSFPIHPWSQVPSYVLRSSIGFDFLITLQ
jgi:hypothetical protein